MERVLLAFVLISAFLPSNATAYFGTHYPTTYPPVNIPGNIEFRERYTGNLSFAVTGNTMRYGYDGCSQLPSSAASINIPSGSNIVAAFLYWSGSGYNDSQVNFAGANVNADVVHNVIADGLSYYSARADVTNRVASGSSSYSVSGLSFDGYYHTYCQGGRAYGGWALVVVYENPQEPQRIVDISDGFRTIHYNSLNLSRDGFIVADNPAALGGKHAAIVWEGDSNITYSEGLSFNGSPLSDIYNPQGNQFNSYSNTTGTNTSGVDIDAYEIGSHLTPGSQSFSSSYSTGQDRIFLSAEIVSIPIRSPIDLSTSIKRVIDLNGGLVRPGDTLRFEIEMTNSGIETVNNLALTDHIPSLISSFQVSGTPVGAQLTTQPAPAGDFGRGVVSLSALTIPAGESRTLTIDAVLSSGAQDGASFTNTAILSGTALNIPLTSSVITVNNILSIPGNKPLYLQPNLTLTRVATTDSSSTIEIANNSSVVWQLSPALQTDMSLDYSQSIPFRFYARNGNDSLDNTAYNHTFEIRLLARRSGTDTLLASKTLTAELLTAGNNSGLEIIREFNTELDVQNSAPLLSGDLLLLSIRQFSNSNSDPVDIFLRRNSNSNSSQLTLTSNTVINVDSIALYDAPYPDGNILYSAQRGQTVYIRSEVSDPFGADDITEATLDLFDPDNNQVLNNISLMAVAANDAIKVFEYSTTVMTDAQIGNWKASIRAEEGYENLVFSNKDLDYPVILYPNLNLTKNAQVISDPINGANNPKAIPGAEIIYTLTALNEGEGQTDADSLIIDDKIPSNVRVYVGDFNGTGPAEFIQGSVNSGLTYNFASLSAANDDLDFSNDNDDSDGILYGYIPQPDAEGFDANVTYIRFMPKGILNPASGGSQPEFTFRYKVKVQ